MIAAYDPIKVCCHAGVRVSTSNVRPLCFIPDVIVLGGIVDWYPVQISSPQTLDLVVSVGSTATVVVCVCICVCMCLCMWVHMYV